MNEPVKRTDKTQAVATNRNAQMGQLLAAVSVLAVSLGMSPSDAAQTAATGGTSVNGIKVHTDTIELKTNSVVGQYTRKKLPGRMKSGQITVTRGTPGGGSTTGGETGNGQTGTPGPKDTNPVPGKPL